MHVYLTPAQARLELFPEAISFEREVRLIPGSFKEDLERRLGRRFDADSLEVYIGYDQNRTLLGYSVVTDEIGKYRPITFMVAMGVDFRVRGAAVLVYRESRGWEVRHDFFTNQFNGARLTERGKLDRPIDGISGATLSVGALVRLARLALYLDDAVAGRP